MIKDGKANKEQMMIALSRIYKLSEAKKAHEDLEGRQILGPAVLIP